MNYQDILEPVALERYATALNSRAGQIQARGRLDAAGLRDRILESAGRCEWCGVNLVDSEFELDHVLSLMRGGANQATNLAVSCPDCNRRKGQKHPARFAAEIHSETGRKTALVIRVLEIYDSEASAQMSLFADAHTASEKSGEADKAQIEPPPYHWTD